MTSGRTKSSQTSSLSEMEKLRRDKFALLAKVGQQKRKASQFQDEAIFYSGLVTELLAVSAEAMQLLREAKPESDPKVAGLSSQQLRLTRQLLSFWPSNSESQSRLLEMLDCRGLAMVTDTTNEGFVIPSSALILESVGRIIAATKAEFRNP